MSNTIDRTSTAYAPSGYWNNEPSEEQIAAAENLPNSTANNSVGTENSTSAVSDRRRGQGDPIAIDGNTNQPQGRTQSSTPDGKPVFSDPLHTGKEVTITRERTVADAGNGQQYVSSDQVVLTTGNKNDKVEVTRNEDGTLGVDVNGERYNVTLADGQELTIRSGAGNDTINVSSDVEVNIVVDGGAGNDTINTGSGNDRVDGGTGNDTIYTGAGRDDVFGNSGNDRISAGAGDDVVYGGDGNDTLFGQNGNDYVEGGKGADGIYGGAGDDILSGGLGNDKIESHSGNDHVYTGQGTDTVSNRSGNDTIYAQQGTDQISAGANGKNKVVNVELTGSPGSQGVRVEGSDGFRQRVEADIEFLRSSPNGRQMLAQFDAAAANGNTVTIRELANEQNGFAQSSGGEIVNGQASPGSDVQISYNPSFHMDAFPAPVVVLYHEMSHAYNGVNGTFQPGTYTGPDLQDANAGVPNAERQAVGLQTTAPAYDFDGNPNTPPTTTNPAQLTENGLRTELGLPLRLHYAL